MIRKLSWGVMLALACVVALYALVTASVGGLRTPFVADLFATKALRAAAHLGAGGVALVTGALQFSTHIRFGRPRAHRGLGWAYLAGVSVSGTAGGLLAPSSSGGITGHFGFGLLAVLWVATAAIAWRAAIGGDYAAHRTWMIRSYALCLAAVTLRLYIPLSAIAGVAFDDAYPAIAWLCWVPNLIVAEWLVVPGSLAPLEPSAG